MEHQEAVEMMASERYLLEELTPELRDAYEDHMFGCVECANDARLGAAFLDQAKILLPAMTPGKRAPVSRPAEAKREWFAWLRPAFVVPVFASLIAVIGYQNLVAYPQLEAAATEPRILPPATILEGATRSGRTVVHADLVLGSMVSVPLPTSSTYASYKCDFYNAAGKLIWTRTVESAGASQDTLTIWLPARIKQGSYKLTVSGVTASGDTVPIQEQNFDVKINK